MDAYKGRRIAILIAAILNVTLIVCVLISVFLAFDNARKASFSQNIENVRTLTDASAEKVEIEYMHHTSAVRAAADYVNNYHQGIGMTQDQMREYFAAYYSKMDNCTWELVDGSSNNASGAQRGFNGLSLQGGDTGIFTYKIQAYPELARLFAAAGEENLGQITYTNEFTDLGTHHNKVNAIATTVRLLEEEGYQYKTLLLLLQSSRINALLSENNSTSVLQYFNYSNIIVDNNGDYVISNSQFQGTNFTDYMELYNEGFTRADTDAIREKLNTEDYADVLYYKNNREQDCAYTIVPVQNSDWHVLSIIPLESFHNSYDFTYNFSLFALFFGLLFTVDIVLVLVINVQLRRKTKEAQEANLAKTAFLSSMSHDIRTPMNAIIGMTFIADDTLKENQPDLNTLKDCIKTIQLSGNHLLTLINDILDISKIENGKVELAAEDFSISESISKMLEILQPQIEEKHLCFEPHIVNVNHEFVHADELRINQVYINILSNAIKYTNPGGKVTVDFAEQPIAGKEHLRRFIYQVRDTGIGMDPAFLKTIFDRFSRAVDTRVNTTQGTGLGMSISKQLVDLMGGTIRVESELNVGSTFTVTLDLPVADKQTEQVNLQGLRALLIDDDAVLLETAEMLLAKAAMEVRATSEGSEGVRLAQAYRQEGHPFDVILVDWKMSGMDGFHVVRALREALGGDVKILVMTAYSIADIEHEARIAGAGGFIMKPLFRSKLLHAIQAQFTDSEEKAAPSLKEHFDLNVLVAEDNLVNWKVLDKILSRYGIHADRVQNGQEAVRAVADPAKCYDIVLMDIQMPVMNGYEAAQAIRRLADPRRAATPVYAMTADTFAEDVARCLECGMDGHLPKPVEVDRLLKVLSHVSEKE